jgi:hypothetical protein
MAGGGTGWVEVVRATTGGFCIHVRIEGILLLTCTRVPGQPYQPLVLATLDEARQAAERIAGVFRTEAGGCQEVYINTQKFTN